MSSKIVIKNCHQKLSPKIVIKNCHKNCHQCLNDKGHRSLGSLFNVKKQKVAHSLSQSGYFYFLHTKSSPGDL